MRDLSLLVQQGSGRDPWRGMKYYVAAHSSNRWGRDIMGKQTLEDGHNLSVTFPHGNGACDFDIKVKYDDDTTAEWRDIDLCKYEAVSLYWDAKKQATRAVGE